MTNPRWIAPLAGVILLPIVFAGHAGGAVPSAVEDAADSYSVRNKKAVEATQRASVHAIDSTLTDMRFDEWFRHAVGPEAKISWELNDCGESTGSPADTARDMPGCVEALAAWSDGRTAFVWLLVGSERRGVSSPTDVYFASAERGDSTAYFHSLPEFSRFLRHGKPPVRPRKKAAH